MAKWFKSVSRGLSRRTPPTDAPFALSCLCGNHLSGMRRERFQRVVCKKCGEVSFVLPQNRYPCSRAQKRRAKPKKSQHAPKRQPPPVPASSDPETQTDTAEARPVSFQTASVDQIKQTLDASVTRARRAITPFRLIVAAMMAIVLLTLYWTLHSRSLDKAREELRVASEAGYAALQDHDWATAYEQFQIADRQIDRLGRHDAAALAIRQMYRQVAAVVNVVDVSLYELIHEANAVKRQGEKAWPKRFDDNYKGAWVIFQGKAKSTMSKDGKPNCEIQYALIVDGVPARVWMDGSVCEQFDIGVEPKPVILAAQLKACRLTQDQTVRWSIELDETTAFLWSDYDSFAAIGFVPNDLQTEAAARAILTEQTRQMGLAP